MSHWTQALQLCWESATSSPRAVQKTQVRGYYRVLPKHTGQGWKSNIFSKTYRIHRKAHIATYLICNIHNILITLAQPHTYQTYTHSFLDTSHTLYPCTCTHVCTHTITHLDTHAGASTCMSTHVHTPCIAGTHVCLLASHAMRNED